MRQAERMEPNRAEIHMALGQVFQCMEKPWRAIDQFKVAWNLGLYTPELYITLGELQLRKEEVKTARRVVLEGLRYFPKNESLIEMLKEVQERAVKMPEEEP
jgi:hypothetical protein